MNLELSIVIILSFLVGYVWGLLIQFWLGARNRLGEIKKELERLNKPGDMIHTETFWFKLNSKWHSLSIRLDTAKLMSEVLIDGKKVSIDDLAVFDRFLTDRELKIIREMR